METYLPSTGILGWGTWCGSGTPCSWDIPPKFLSTWVWHQPVPHPCPSDKSGWMWFLQFHSCQTSIQLYFWHSQLMIVLYFNCNFDVGVWRGKLCLPTLPSWPEAQSSVDLYICGQGKNNEKNLYVRYSKKLKTLKWYCHSLSLQVYILSGLWSLSVFKSKHLNCFSNSYYKFIYMWVGLPSERWGGNLRLQSCKIKRLELIYKELRWISVSGQDGVTGTRFIFWHEITNEKIWKNCSQSIG